MKTKSTAILVTAALPASCLLPGNAEAGIIVNIEQQGSDVVIDYSGSWDVWSRTDFGSSISDLTVYSKGFFNLPAGSNYDFIGPGQGLTKDSGLWTTVNTQPDSTAGDILAWNHSYTYAPLGYTAGNPIVGSMTFNNTDLATMGFTPGDSGSWSGGAGTVNYSVSGAAAIPEPSGVLGLAGLILGSGFLRRRKLA